MGTTILKARAVVPVSSPPIDNGVVAIEGDRIAFVGAANASHGKEIDLGVDLGIDLGDVAIFPGLVNTHTHLEFSSLSEPLGQPGTEFSQWIREAISHRSRRSHNPKKAIFAGCAECVSRGVTTVGEVATADPRLYFTNQYTMPRMTMFREAIGFSRARADSALAACVEQIDALGQLFGHASNAPQPAISPHAPYTVSPQLVRDLVAHGRAHDMPVAMHLAESLAEMELFQHGTGPFRELLEERSMWDPEVIPLGSRPLDYLEMLAGAPQALVIHGNYLNGSEFEFLAKYRANMSLVHCPRTHACFGHSAFPLGQLLEGGVRVVLGTDSRASNPDLCLLSEMRFIHRQHPALSADQIIRMGTLDAAAAIGRADEVGSLAVGKFADLVVVPLPSGFSGTAMESLPAILESDDAPSQTWLGGSLL